MKSVSPGPLAILVKTVEASLADEEPRGSPESTVMCASELKWFDAFLTSYQAAEMNFSFHFLVV